MARPPPPGCVLPPHTQPVARPPPPLPPRPSARFERFEPPFFLSLPSRSRTSTTSTSPRAYSHPVHPPPPPPPPWRGTSRASIFRVKDGATDAIGPRRGLPRRIVVCGASHRSRLRPMRNPESQPLASRRPRPATYPDRTDTPSDNLQLSRPRSRLPPSPQLPSSPPAPCARQRALPLSLSCHLPPTPSNLSARPVLASGAVFPSPSLALPAV